jgi:hypothetical protein
MLGNNWNAPLSETGLRRLVDLVFYTSLSRDEGRFLRFTVAAFEAKKTIFNVASFAPVRLESPGSLLRLAPASSHPDCALLIKERNGQLYCHGVVNVGPMGYEWAPGTPHVSGGASRPPSFELTVRDPANLMSAGGEYTSYELRAGKIRRLSPYWILGPVKDLSGKFRDYLEKEVTKQDGSDAAKIVGGPNYSQQFHHIMSRMLRIAIEARHGGAFVIIPTDSSDANAFGIRLKYPTSNLDLGLNAINYWLACVEYVKSETTDNSLLRRTIVSRSKMLTEAEVAGNLSGVDGCVVLNRKLQVCRFGGEILVSDDEARKAIRPFTDVASGDEWSYDDFMKGIGGTRHKSAARLCRAHANVLVFVVSQDGDLKLFYSNEKQVNGFGPLDLPKLGSPLS